MCGACSEQRGSDASDPPTGEQPTTAPTTSAASRATAATTSSTAAPTTSSTTTSTTSTTSTTTTLPATTTTVAATTTAPAAAPAACLVEIKPGDSLFAIVSAIGNEAVTVQNVQAENGIANPNTINAGDYLDVCVGNGVDDVTGAQRTPAPAPVEAVASGTGVAAQQQKLNELFGGYGLPALTADGDSGRLTEQQLCGARVALGLPISRADMEPGGAEEQALMAAGSVPIPAGAPTSSSRWVLIDQTCQLMFVGEGNDRLVHVFRTSTGEPGHETRNQNGSRAFRFDPARENDGWHNSIDYPVPGDNPLNGNMYMPLYFDNGQAIHGANNVPTDPRSKGCARLRVENQNALLDWLGLRDARRADLECRPHRPDGQRAGPVLSTATPSECLLPTECLPGGCRAADPRVSGCQSESGTVVEANRRRARRPRSPRSTRPASAAATSRSARSRASAITGASAAASWPMSWRIVRSVREAMIGVPRPSTQTRVRRPSPRSSPRSGSRA